jgi:hypothetical protein
MYSFGKKGKIQTTISTVNLIKTHYRCSKANGGEKIMIKGKGMMMCYYIDGRLPSYPASERATKTAITKPLAEKYLTRDDGGETEMDEFAKRLRNGTGATTGVGKALWINDSEFSNCMRCEKAFTFTFRRHHCRYCGLLLCSECTQKKLDKERVCDLCFTTHADASKRDVFLHLARIRRIEEKLGKAHHNFESPYTAMYHCCRSGTSKSLEFEYLVKRKTAVRSLLLYSWFAVLFFLVMANHIINDFLLPFRCIDKVTGSSKDCDTFNVLTPNGPGESFGGLGQAVFYTSQTKHDLNAVKDSVAKSMDTIAESRGVNITNATQHGKTWTNVMSVDQYVLPLLGIFDDNTIVVVSYTHEDAVAVPEYGIDRLMYAKTLFSFGIIPMIVGFILISMLDYNINQSKWAVVVVGWGWVCNVLCWIVLYCIVLYWIALYCIVLHCIVLYS